VKLSEEALGALDDLKAEHGLKTREVISLAVNTFCDESVYEKVAKLEPDLFKGDLRRSVVIAPEALRRLNDAVKRSRRTRDSLLNLFIILLRLTLKKAEKERPIHLLSILDDLQKLCSEIGALESKSEKLLGEDDPVKWRLGTIAVVTDNLYFARKAEIEEGTPVDPDEL